jgi:hypothetical protein
MRKIYLSFSLLFMLLQSNAQDPTFQLAKQFVGQFKTAPEKSYGEVSANLVTSDAAGQLLNKVALPNLNNRISMAAYNVGIYFVRVKKGDTVIATKKNIK